MSDANEFSKNFENDKLWGGRFIEGTNPIMASFNSSIQFDKFLWEVDIKGSIAYATALEKCGLVTTEENMKLRVGLSQVAEEWASNKFIIKNDEDIHSANERRLKEIVGSEIGGKLHTGRSRNDQVTTDIRLWLRDQAAILKALLLSFVKLCCDRAKREIDILMPGYTHLQRAQPIRWSHWLLSYAWYFHNDANKLEDILSRMNICPLGSGAIAGNPFSVDRDFLAKELGFSGCTPNSMLAVSDRDFIAEFLFWGSLVATHFSKFAEDLILYNTKEFGFVTIADAFSTGSSLMPQKKNPDSLELIRGKSGRLIGNCVGYLTVLKGLPSTYNKDLQEDKEPLFDTYSTLTDVFQIACGTLETLKDQGLWSSSRFLDLGLGVLSHICAGQVVILTHYLQSLVPSTQECMFSTHFIDPEGMRVMSEPYPSPVPNLGPAAWQRSTLATGHVNKEVCYSALSPDMLATDVAYYLVKKGIPFRAAHKIAGEVVSLAEKENCKITELTLSQLKQISHSFEDSISDLWNYEHSVEQYQAFGGTARSNIQIQIEQLEMWISDSQILTTQV